ncbi:MAG TPA: hypothetical protein VH257_14710 [Chloroflexota bacterium]|nr:hypothetical protein [Chloroflexota bacterium]
MAREEQAEGEAEGEPRVRRTSLPGERGLPAGRLGRLGRLGRPGPGAG